MKGTAREIQSIILQKYGITMLCTGIDIVDRSIIPLLKKASKH